METFGVIKNKMIKHLTESYLMNKKSELKESVNILKTDNQFRDLYLFYEDMEHKHIDDIETAKLFVEEISSMLKEKKPLVENTCKELSKKFSDVIVESNPLYDALDKLMEVDTLRTIDSKLIAKKKIVEFITVPKKIEVKEEIENFTKNENLLFSVMTNSFNNYFDEVLSEEEKKEFNEIMNLSEDDLNNKISELKENLLNKIDNLLTETVDVTLKEKLANVKSEVNKTDVSKYTYFKLKNLLTDLN